MKMKPVLSLLLWLLTGPATLTQAFPQQNPTQNKSENNPAIILKIFDEAWDTIDKCFFDPNFQGVNWPKMKEIYRPQAAKAKDIDALLDVIRKMMAEIKISHMGIRVDNAPTKEELEEAAQRIGRTLKMGEIPVFRPGIVGAIYEKKYLILSVETGSPADRMGVKPGWIWTVLNGHSLAGENVIPPSEWLNRSEKNSYRFMDQNNTEHDLSFATEWFIPVQKPEVDWRMLEGNIGYIAIHGFRVGYGEWMKQSVTNFMKAKAHAMIIDLRSCGGGDIAETARCLSPFFKKNAVMGTAFGRDGMPKRLVIKGSGRKAFTGKVVILTDEYTGSAAEMFCAALADHQLSKIVGKKTFGAALGAADFHLSNSIVLSVPINDYRTSNGIRIEGVGVAPDYEIDASTLERIGTQRDRWLEKAKEILGENR